MNATSPDAAPVTRPGTASVAGDPAATPGSPATHLWVLEPNGSVVERDPEDLSELRDRPAWLDLCDPEPAALELIARELKLHPLAVEDAEHRLERPKLDDYDTHAFLVFYGIATGPDGGIVLHELSIFVAENVLVTVHVGDSAARQALERRWREGRIPSTTRLLYALLDHIVDEYFAVVDDLGDRVDALESAVVTDRTGKGLQDALAELFAVKRDLLRLRKIVAPERDVLALLTRGEHTQIDEATRVYYRDVYDHLLRVTDEIDTFRDIISNVIDAALAATSNRLNEVMKVLTSIATILLVLTVVTGFFGQNFTALIPYESPWLFGGSIVFMIAAAASLALYFRRRGWL